MYFLHKKRLKVNAVGYYQKIAFFHIFLIKREGQQSAPKKQSLLQNFMSIDGTTLLFFLFLSYPRFCAGPQKPRTLTDSKISMKIFDQKFKFLVEK